MGKSFLFLIISFFIFYDEVNILFDMIFLNGVKYKRRKNKIKRFNNEINVIKNV